MAISLLPYVATLSEQFYFWRSYLFTLFQGNYFESSLGQLLFGTATFLAEELFRTKIPTEELLFLSRYLQHTFSEE